MASQQMTGSGAEYRVTPEMTIISHTDGKGMITWCNHDFVEASGYTYEELIGKPHNILRHPDMPAEAFRDLWDTVRRGKPWSGIVKNRRKDGGFYWVRASVTPLPDGSGYTSVRGVPTPEEVSSATSLYKRMAGGEKIHLHEGQLARVSSNPINQLNISRRLWLMALLPMVIITALTASGLYFLKSSRDALKTVYEERTVAINHIAEINDLNQMSLIDLNLAEEALEAKNDPGPHLAEVRKNKTEIDKAWAEYMAGSLGDEEKKLAEDHQAKRNAMWSAIDDVAAQIAAGNAEQANVSLHQRLMGQLRWPQEESIDKLKDYQVEQAKSEYEHAARAYDHSLKANVTVTVFGVLLILAMVNAISRYIAYTLKKMAETSIAIAKGNLLQLMPPTLNDEIGELVAAVAIMRNSQHEVIATLRRNAENLENYSKKLGTSASNGAQTAVDQYMAVTSMTAATDKLTTSFESIEAIASKVTTASERSSEVANSGGQIIHDAAHEMRKIADAVNTTADSIQQLEDMSRQITTIVNVIREIADQTNLLALNAAIEAARAGEAGRGFAVVADEVRKLAVRTAESTSEITAMITKIQAGTAHAVDNMSAAVTRANEGVELAYKAGDSVIGIRAEAEQVSLAANEITAALKEQSLAAQDISQKITHVAHGAVNNSAAADETATLAQKMAEVSEALTRVTAYFKI